MQATSSASDESIEMRSRAGQGFGFVRTAVARRAQPQDLLSTSMLEKRSKLKLDSSFRSDSRCWRRQSCLLCRGSRGAEHEPQPSDPGGLKTAKKVLEQPGYKVTPA